MNIFHVTRCIAAPRAYGGFNRSQQILGILSRQGINCMSIDLFAEDFGGRAGNLRAGLALALRRGFPKPRSYSRLWVAGHYHRLLASALARQPAIRPVLIWEDTEDDLLAYAATQLGLKVIAIPHDLVTLNRPASREPWPDLAREVRGLARSHGLFTISEEERWLLQLLGCSAGWLPYYPPAALETSLLRARATTPRDRRSHPPAWLNLEPPDSRRPGTPAAIASGSRARPRPQGRSRRQWHP